MADAVVTPGRWTLVVPVKRLDAAKTRLDALAGDRRPDLALALARDTVAAATACRGVTVLVVSDDTRAVSALETVGAVCVPDVPDAGLNPALAYGADEARRHDPGTSVAALSADLPALRPAALARALTTARGHPTAFVADAAGTGTTLLTARADASLTPRFGPRSRARHAADGAYELGGSALASLRRDVDTEVDLRDALRLGVGPATAEVAAALGLHVPGPGGVRR